MSKIFEYVSTTVLVAAALVVAASTVSRNKASNHSTAVVATKSATSSDDLATLSRLGTLIGDSTARVKVVVFSDYECPYCREFNERFKAIHDSVGEAVSLLVVHFPLTMHRFARPAALAAECSDSLRMFPQIHDLFLAKQDSLGLKSWTSFAWEAGVRDTLEFQNCLSRHQRSSRIDSSLKIGAKLKVEGTPTVIINGTRYSSAPYDSLASIVRQILEQK